MKVKIIDRQDYRGIETKTVEIDDNCPKCGQRRGQPRLKSFYRDGQSFAIDVWENACGHVDSYEELR